MEITAAPQPKAEKGRLNLWLPYLALFFGVIALGSTAIFVRLADAPGSVFAFYRMAIAVTVTAIPFGMQAKRR